MADVSQEAIQEETRATLRAELRRVVEELRAQGVPVLAMWREGAGRLEVNYNSGQDLNFAILAVAIQALADECFPQVEKGKRLAFLSEMTAVYPEFNWYYLYQQFKEGQDNEQHS